MSNQMKKILCIISVKSIKMLFIIIFLLCILPALLWAQLAGDSNNDYVVNFVDALLISQYYIHLNPPNFDIDNVDVNLDNKINVVDALLISQLIVGHLSKLPASEIVKDITLEEGKEIFEKEADFLFLDIRSAAEFNKGSIEGAINMPLDNGYLAAHHNELPAKPVIVYGDENSDSSEAVEFLVNNNHVNVFHMPGGYAGWIDFEPAEIGGNFIWIEAESGAVYKPQILKSDSYADNSPNDTASGEIYFEVSSGRNSINSAPSDGHMVYQFGITSTAQYRIWARVKTPTPNDDSFWLNVDSGPWKKWDNIGNFTQWGWAVAGDYNLTQGTHTLTFAYCEDGARFDKLLITDEIAYTPTGLGESEAVNGNINNFHTTNVVDKHGNLRVIGTNLCNQSGEPIQLRGVNTHGPQWYPVTINQTIPNLAETWSISIVRLAMYVEDFKNGDFWNGYLAHKEEIKAIICDMADDAISAGIYVIIDWHIHNNPTNFTAAAVDFFTEMSGRYGKYPNVLFEICNEPEYTDWPVIKEYVNQVIPAIRKNDSDSNENIIIVGTPNWSQDVHIAADDPLHGYTNIMYALHFYAASHQQTYRDNVRYALNKGLPIIATEWSACDYDVTFNNFDEANTWVSLLNSNRISWINWSFCNRDDASAILKPGVSITGPWAKGDLTTTGSWIKQRIAE
ncbi:MAG: cellulase family glycosylhydrolase [Spirochaetales bacterium]|nr:cellulase family glycosylhydrolase [Spirochaetales bacterium]